MEALIPLSEDYRQQLSKIIDQMKRFGDGFLFAEPVDYIGLGIPDYPKVIKNPMDLSTLKKNLFSFKYQTLGDFLKDSALIWSNCRIYNGSGNEGYYIKASNECEKVFVLNLMKIKEFGLTMESYKKIVGFDREQEQIQEKRDEFNAQNIQQIVKRLQEVPESCMLDLIKWFCKEKGVPVDVEKPEFQLKFDKNDMRLLKELDEKISKKVQEIKDAKKRRFKKKDEKGKQ